MTGVHTTLDRFDARCLGAIARVSITFLYADLKISNALPATNLFESMMPAPMVAQQAVKLASRLLSIAVARALTPSIRLCSRREGSASGQADPWTLVGWSKLPKKDCRYAT